MKKSLLLSLLAAVALVGCNSNNNSSSSENIPVSNSSSQKVDFKKDTNLKMITPTGAPTLAFLNYLHDDSYETNTTPANIIASMNAGTYDIVVVDTIGGMNAISKGAEYKMAATITFGNYFIYATGNDDNGVMEAGDTIISYNGQTVTNWQDLTNAIQSTTETTTITYSRNGQTSTIEITPEISDREGTKVAMLGIEPEYKKSFLTGLEYSVLKTKEAFVSIFETFKMLFVTKEAGINDLSGPVGIYTMTSTIATYGLTSLLIWIGFLSVNIGVMNLLPIPALDGGRILFVLIESIIGRPVDRRIEGYIHTVGLLLFFGLFVYVTFNDIIRLITA